MRQLLSLLTAATVVLVTGCTLLHRTTPAAPSTVARTPPTTPAPAARTSRPSDSALLVERAVTLRSLSLYVDTCVEAQTPEGRGFASDRNRVVGEIVAAALRREFDARGFDLRGSFVTSVGLGFGSLAPADASTQQRAPFYVSEALTDGERRRWFDVIYASVRDFADGRGTPDSIRCATYLNANTPRLLCFATITGRETAGEVGRHDTRAALHALLVDSETGRVLWAGTSALAGHSLDEARLHRLAADLLRHVPNVTVPAH